MRKTIILLSILSIWKLTSVVHGQIVKPLNIYRVTVVSEYEIVNGNYTSKSKPLFQFITDSLGRLHTEIDYNIETRYPDNYRWHYFDGQTKKKTEFYLKEKLNRIEEYDHQANGLLSQLTIYGVSDTDTLLSVRETYTYNSNGLLTRTTGYNSRGKRGYRVSYKYDDNGTEIERKISGRRLTPPDSIRHLKRTPVYDSLIRITSETLEVEKVGKGKTTRKIEYKYDAQNNLIEKTLRDNLGNQIKRKEFVYRPDNRLQRRSIYDADNNLVQFRAWRYEIYRTSDRRHRVLE